MRQPTIFFNNENSQGMSEVFHGRYEDLRGRFVRLIGTQDANLLGRYEDLGGRFVRLKGTQDANLLGR